MGEGTSLADEVRELRQRVAERMAELEPMVREYEQLQKVAAELGIESEQPPPPASDAARARGEAARGGELQAGRDRGGDRGGDRRAADLALPAGPRPGQRWRAHQARPWAVSGRDRVTALVRPTRRPSPAPMAAWRPRAPRPHARGRGASSSRRGPAAAR